MPKKIVEKKISFIVPELDENDKGEISKRVYRELVKYGELPIGNAFKEVFDVKIYVNYEAQLFNEIEMDNNLITLIGDDVSVNIYPSGEIGVDGFTEGDRIDVELPFETGITVEDKVASSFEGLAEGSVGFKLYRDGDVIDVRILGSGFSKTFISIFKEGSEGDHYIQLKMENGTLLYTHSGGILNMTFMNGELYLWSGNDLAGQYNVVYGGNIIVSSATYDGCLVELVVK